MDCGIQNPGIFCDISQFESALSKKLKFRHRMETHTNSSEKSIISPFKWLGELVEFIEEPTREKIFPLDLSNIEPRDHEFFRRLKVLSAVDPE